MAVVVVVMVVVMMVMIVVLVVVMMVFVIDVHIEYLLGEFAYIIVLAGPNVKAFIFSD